MQLVFISLSCSDPILVLEARKGDTDLRCGLSDLAEDVFIK